MNEYSKIKLTSAWNDRKLDEKVKLMIELRADQLNLPYHRTGWLVDNFSATFDKLGNIVIGYFVSDKDLIKTKLFKHPVLLQDVEPVILEIADWLLEIDEEYGNW